VTQSLGSETVAAAYKNRTEKIAGCLSRLRVLPIATLSPEEALSIGGALVGAGLPCLEVTFRAEGAAQALATACEVGGLLVGAGTVLNAWQAEAAAAAGAAFAVAPGLNEEVVTRCRELGLPFFPGVATPTEIDRARRLGLRHVKVFPISSLGGVPFLRAVSATFPGMRFIPTGGITPSNLREYLALRNVIACAGSWLIDADDGQPRRVEAIAARAREALELTR
jgi:2-dehydro-3-deoxyphosphogluconate aldolase / (4S)-4-hydroxy-2-oxoglutarate aldolase